MNEPTIKQQKELIKRAQLQTKKLQELVTIMREVTNILKAETLDLKYHKP
tara:strand:- start:963 stop:1112 length:150 start_codon:yes stop_codon:yes gene_type:complete